MQKVFERKGASFVKTLAYAVSMQLAVLSEMAKEIVFWLKILRNIGVVDSIHIVCVSGPVRKHACHKRKEGHTTQNT